jgi:ankyrin repeat protein
MLAAYHGHAELVKLLLQNGADPNRVNDRQQSPLAGAVFKKEDAVVQVGCYRACTREADTGKLTSDYYLD